MFIKKEFFTQFKHKLLAFFNGGGGPEIHVGENNEITITGPQKVEAPVTQQKPEQVAKNQPKNTAKEGENLANQFEGNVLQAEMTDIKPEDIPRVLGMEPQQNNKPETIEEKKIDLVKIFDAIDDPIQIQKIENLIKNLIESENTDKKENICNIKIKKNLGGEVEMEVYLKQRELGLQENGKPIWNAVEGKTTLMIKKVNNGIIFDRGPNEIQLPGGKTNDELKKLIILAVKTSK